MTNEVKKLRHYEESLLVNYQAYLQLLNNEVKGMGNIYCSVSMIHSLKKTGTNQILTIASTTNKHNAKEDVSCAFVAVQCMCDLLTSVTHFNFRLNLMTAVITRMSTSKINEVCNSSR